MVKFIIYGNQISNTSYQQTEQKSATSKYINLLKLKHMKTLKSILILSALMLSGNIFAQSEGTIKGTVLDERSLPLPFTQIAILQDSTLIASKQADENGEFTFKDITAGKYNVKVYATSYNIHLREKVIIRPNKTNLGTVIVSEKFRQPVVDPEFTALTSISIDQIENAAVGKTDIIGLITMVTPGVLATPDGKDIYVRGSRRGSTIYYVDGNRTMDVPDVPGMGIAGMEILTGGVPASYGDCTGGVVVITTKEYKWEMNRKQNKIDDRKERDAASNAKKKEIEEYDLFE